MKNQKKVCSKCGEEKLLEEFVKDKRNKDGRGCYCKDCMNQYTKKWRKENPEKEKEWQKKYSKKYYEEHSKKVKENNIKWLKNNPEKVKEYSKKYREEHSEKEKERKKKYREDNPEKVKEYSKKYREDNPEKIKKCGKKYREKNFEKIIYYKHLRRHLYKRGLITQQFIKELKKNTIICECCNQPIKKYHLDHIIPVTIGGEFIPENMRFICQTCNLKRPKNGNDLLNTKYKELYLKHIKEKKDGNI